MLTAAPEELDDVANRVLAELALHRDPSVDLLADRLEMPHAPLQKTLQSLHDRGLLAAPGAAGKASLRRDLGFVVAVDMGATNLRCLVADLSGEILDQTKEKVSNADGPAGAIQQIRHRIEELVAKTGRTKDVRAIAIGVPSAVHPHSGLLVSANNLPGWTDVAMAPSLENEFGVPVVLDNDCNMAAVGEHWRGAATKAQNFVFLAIGTGIGSGVFINGKLYQGRTGSAGEVYLMNLDWHLWDHTFPDTGHLESYVSGIGIAEQGRKAGLLLSHPHEDAAPNDDRDSRRVFAAMNRGDARARKVIEDIFTVLGVGIANMISMLDPELIVLNGGLTKGDPNFLLETVNTVVRRIHPDPPLIRLSALADKAQIYGSLWTGLKTAYASLSRSAACATKEPRNAD